MSKKMLRTKYNIHYRILSVLEVGMEIRVGTFNLNNLFSRFNFRAEVETDPSTEEGGITLTFGSEDTDVRTFMGRLVREKSERETREIAERILENVNADILAVQEVEHIEILKQFNRTYLHGAYPEVVLIEGNDNRLIDVGLLSKLPIGAITSHQTAKHPGDPNRRVFGRDLLEVEVLSPSGRKLITVYNNHLKSHFVPHGEDPIEGRDRANARRRRQAETIARILSVRESSDSQFVLLGDMNDPPESEFLQAMLDFNGPPLVNGLKAAVETRPPKPETPGQGDGPSSPIWTHRFNPPGADTPPEYELLDQIWLSPNLQENVISAHIDRRTKHGGDGSDHDPAWVVLDL